MFTLSWSCDQLMQKAYSSWNSKWTREIFVLSSVFMAWLIKLGCAILVLRGWKSLTLHFILLLQVEHNLSVISGMMLPIILEPKQEKVKEDSWILSEFSWFWLKILNLDLYAIGIGNILILTSVLIFSIESFWYLYYTRTLNRVFI